TTGRPAKLRGVVSLLHHPKSDNQSARKEQAMASQLLGTKSPDLLISESEAPERQMKRTLSAVESFSSRLKTPLMNFITAWLSGSEVQLGRPGAGPALIFSLIVAAIACAFAALCYAELASMIPVSGSAYTYAYATLGEIFAW